MNKYRNKITYINGMKFDSKKEAMHYLILRDRLEKGEIENLRMQVSYELLPSVYEEQIVHLKTKDKKVRKCVQRAVTYIADFVYYDKKANKEIIVDVKGGKAGITKEFLLKKKMFKYLCGKDIVIV